MSYVLKNQPRMYLVFICERARPRCEDVTAKEAPR